MGRRGKEIEKQQNFHLLNKVGISYWQMKDLQERTCKRNLMRVTRLLILQKWFEHCSAMIGFEFLSELCKIHQNIIAVISPWKTFLLHGAVVWFMVYPCLPHVSLGKAVLPCSWQYPSFTPYVASRSVFTWCRINWPLCTAHKATTVLWNERCG